MPRNLKLSVKRELIDASIEMKELLELSDKDFKTDIVKIL